MTYEFLVPSSRDDLLNRTGPDQYVVDEVYTLRNLPTIVRDYKSSVRTKGGLTVLTAFDGIFSVLMNWNDADIHMKETTWETLLDEMNQHTAVLPNLVDENTMDHHTRLQHLNAVKMHCYLLCQMMEAFENTVTSSSTVLSVKGRRKKTDRVKNLAGFNWDSQSEVGVRTLLKTIQINIHRLWEPPVVEEEFINMVTSCCYKLLENSKINRNKPTRDNIFHLMAIVIKKYNHSLGASLKIIQLLQHFEHLTSPLAQAVEMFVNEYGSKAIVGEIMREIGRMDARDLVRDNTATHAFSLFLTELAEKIPHVMLPNLSVLVHFLDDEPYTMRNCVLTMMGDILIITLSGENLDEKQKSTRDSFLDQLEEHIHDVHAFVRAKVIQVWLRIVENKALPLTRQEDVVDMIIGRLEDTSSQVRKYAIQFVRTLLESNPFAAKLSLEELKENYEKEKAKLKEMVPDRNSDVFTENAKEIENEWDRVYQKLGGKIRQYLDTEEEIDPSFIDDTDDAKSVVDRLRKMIKEEQLEDVVPLLMAAKDAFPDSEILKDSLADESQSQEMDEITPANRVLQTFKNIYLASAVNLELLANPSSQAASQDDSTVNEVAKQQFLVQYLKDSMVFAGQIQKALSVICQLLGSKVQTDVLEAVEFFVAAFDFGVLNAMRGVRAMFTLVYSKENKVKDSVVNAYKRLYLTPADGNARAQAMAVVNNLTALTIGACKKELTSMEELVCEYVKNGDITEPVIKLLWERFTMKISNTTSEESRAALVLLGMAAKAEENIARSNIDILVSEGLGPRARQDLMLARDACIMLLRIGGSVKPKAGQTVEPFRLSESHSIFTELQNLLYEGFFIKDDNHWVPMAEQAVNVIYKLAEHPDTICGNVIKRLLKQVFTDSSTSDEREVNAVMEVNNSDSQGSAGSVISSQVSAVSDSQDFPKDIQCSTVYLTKLLSMAGHMALRQLIHLDVAVFGEFKRRRVIQDEENEKGKANKKKSKLTSVSDTVSKSRQESTTTVEAIEDELGLAGGAEEDVEAEYIRKICEEDLISGDNLLALFQPIIVAVCSNPSKYSDPDLQSSAALALAKFMLVSSEFCDSQLQLLFTILDKSPSPVIRANTIIALGDLTFRFPNNIEPWTGHLYARLQDDSILVRRSTLTVLTHLILNDMVKVKGQISEMAKCIMDDDPRISGLAKLFFQELARKGNAVYNNLPDMISRLSDPDIGVSEEFFQTIMKLLFAYIQKDKQSESLVEKLCHRFKATRSERQARDLALCLSMLNYSERSVRKIQENFPCFADKLHDEQVFNYFQTIVASSKKSAKVDTKTMIEELEARLEECHLKGADAELVAQKASKASAAAKARKRSPRKSPKTPGKTRSPPIVPRATRRKTTTTAVKKKPFELSDDDDDLILPTRSVPRPKRQTGKSRAPVIESDDDDDNDDDDDDEDDEVAVTRRSVKPNNRRGKIRQKIIMDSDDDELFEMDS
ncbi:condensin complex subunit 1-like isoform X2 [Tubulanus polymorphus]|uniref:condensin complex subunit 1-like isoform X2 n=1 Tax=Tubulanus polymorphus TaxID=672921 RepID=UPI003DA61685